MTNLAKYYDSKVKLYKPSKVRELKILELLGADVKNKNILDIGCADGTFGDKLTKQGATVYGVDVSPLAVSAARKKIQNAFVVDINSQKLPFRSKNFDLVIASEVVEHLFNPKKLLSEAKRTLKDNGALLLTTPNFLYWGNRIAFLFGSFKYEKSGMFDESHVHFYTYKSLKAELDEAGLEILKENHIYAGTEMTNSIKRALPSVFAYQFVISSRKK